ncbi:MAG TPA: fumarylacetoacetate hydrolase family protein [Actinomycetes bacterium]|nr:fumarylacetoacetate hydrolase family protein [Actinomycetes bacterium]
MRIARISLDGTPAFGLVEGAPGSETVTVLAGHPFGVIERTERTVDLADVRLLAPVLPSKVVGVGRNYAEHVREMGGEIPDEPVLFLKPSTSVIGPGDPIPYPMLSHEVHHEGELAVVIGRLIREVPIQRAFEAVLGYTCGNDVTARDLQRSDAQWTRAKGFDGFCPLGPWIETELDPSDVALTCSVNGELRQSSRTSLLMRGVAELVAFVSAVMTLLPGDVILTGTPAGVGPLHVGDTVSVEVEGIGTLRNPVVGDD